MSNSDDGSFSGIGYRENALRKVRKDVSDALTAETGLDASQIGVSVNSATGDVILTGSVPTQAERQLAQDRAMSVKGVHVVFNRLTVANR